LIFPFTFHCSRPELHTTHHWSHARSSIQPGDSIDQTDTAVWHSTQCDLVFRQPIADKSRVWVVKFSVDQAWAIPPLENRNKGTKSCWCWFVVIYSWRGFRVSGWAIRFFFHEALLLWLNFKNNSGIVVVRTK
jgi:hypothetical protein